MQMREIRCGKVIFITATNNSLLTTAFGLKLLRLGPEVSEPGCFSAKSQALGYYSTHVKLAFRKPHLPGSFGRK